MDVIKDPLGSASSIFGIGSSIMEGNAADKVAKFKAKQIERNATAKRAQGTRQAQELKRQGSKAQSDMQAIMAAGGGSTTDAGAIEQKAKLEQITDYNALTALFEAEEQATGMDLAAKGVRLEGKMAKKKGQRKAIGTIMEDASSFFGFGL
jgi:hypothetical protein